MIEVGVPVSVRVLDNLYSVKVGKATPDNAGIGTYAANTGEIGASATYRMD
jgi:hypothetical protein